MDIHKARELIGETNTEYTDEQIQEMTSTMETLADIIIDEFLKMSPEERRKFTEKKNKSS